MTHQTSIANKIAFAVKSLRTVALAVALAVTGSAWATDYVTTWSQDFNDASSYTANWTNGRPKDEREGTTADSGRCMVWSQATYTDADGAENTCFCLKSENTDGKISGSVLKNLLI